MPHLPVVECVEIRRVVVVVQKSIVCRVIIIAAGIDCLLRSVNIEQLAGDY